MIALSRRRLLAAATLLLARPALAAPVTLEPSDPDQAALRFAGIDDPVTVPQDRARIAFMLPIADREVAGVAFAADPPGAKLDLVALAGWDGACLRLLGLEVLSFADASGASLSSRFAGVGDRTRLRIERSGSVPRPGLPLHWESWTDLLAWHDQGPLADAPVRMPLPGTRQAALAAARARVIALLTEPCRSVTPSLIAAAQTALP